MSTSQGGSGAQQYPPGYLEQNASASLIVANTVMLVSSMVLLALRFYARSLTSAGRGWDEYLLTPAWTLLLGLIIIIYIAIPEAGVCQHSAVVVVQDPSKLTIVAKLIYTLDWFYVPSGVLSRMSVVLLYLRVFTSKASRISCWLVIAFLAAHCLATLLAANLECIPLAYTWDKTIEGGTCFNQVVWWQMSCIPNAVVDVTILVLPIPTIWKLRASAARKSGIALVCSIGSIGLVASIVRLSIFLENAALTLTDPTWEGCQLLSWTVVECGMYFNAACLVGLRPLFHRLPGWCRRYATYNGTHKTAEGGTRTARTLGGTAATAINDYDYGYGSTVKSLPRHHNNHSKEHNGNNHLFDDMYDEDVYENDDTVSLSRFMALGNEVKVRAPAAAHLNRRQQQQQQQQQHFAPHPPPPELQLPTSTAAAVAAAAVGGAQARPVLPDDSHHIHVKTRFEVSTVKTPGEERKA